MAASDPSRPSPLLRIIDKVQRGQTLLAAAALVLMMLVTVLDVALRYLFNSPVRGSYEFTEAMLVVFVFNGLAAAFFTRGNIVIDALDHLLGPRITTVLVRLGDLLTLATLLLLGWAMMRMALQIYDYGDRKLELQLPVFVLWLAALVALAGIILAAIGALRRPALTPHAVDPQTSALQDGTPK